MPQRGSKQQKSVTRLAEVYRFLTKPCNGYLEYLGVTDKVDAWRETTRRHLEKRSGLR